MTQFENHHLGAFFYLNTVDTPSKFRLGISALGGTHVLGAGGDGKAWSDMSAYINEINISSGLTLTGINAEAEGLVASIVLSAPTDIFQDRGLIVGTWIKITLENYVAGVASQPMFYVKVRNITKELDSNNIFRWGITASDLLPEVLATPITEFDTGLLGLSEGAAVMWATAANQGMFQTVPDLGELFMFQTEINPDYTHWSFYDDIVINEGTFAEIAQPIIQGDAAWIYSTGQSPQMYAVSHDELLSGQAARTDIITITPDETDSNVAFEYINISENDTSLVNDVLLSLDWDPLAVINWQNQDLIDINGRNKQELEMHYLDETGLQDYADRIAAVSPKIIKSLTVDAIAHKNRHLHDVWKLYPSAQVYVNISTALVTVIDHYFVTRVEHSITPEGWTTKLELWKG